MVPKKLYSIEHIDTTSGLKDTQIKLIVKLSCGHSVCINKKTFECVNNNTKCIECLKNNK